MIDKPFFSIVIVTFNSENTIKKCLKSVFNQSFKSWEIVLIDGKSKDSTMNIVNNYKKNIAFTISEKDNGIYDAMNKGILNSKGDFVYFLNSDDEFYDNDVLKDVYDFINSKKQQINLLTANVVKIYPKFYVLKNNKLSLSNLKKGIMPPHQSMFTHRNIFKNIGMYKTIYKSSGDFDFCCKLFKNDINSTYFNRIIAKFYSGGMSNNKKIAYNENYHIIKNYFGLYYSLVFYINKILIEQLFKKLLTLLNLKNLSNFITKISMENYKDR